MEGFQSGAETEVQGHGQAVWQQEVDKRDRG